MSITIPQGRHINVNDYDWSNWENELYSNIEYRVDQVELDLDNPYREDIVNLIVLEEAEKVQDRYQLIYYSADSPQILKKLSPLYTCYPTDNKHDGLVANFLRGFIRGVNGGLMVGSIAQPVQKPTGYRYVSEPELKVIKQTGQIPNTNARGIQKDVYVSPNKYTSVIEAEKALQIGQENPWGATDSPMYRVEYDLTSVNYKYIGSVEGGYGVEMITEQSIPVDLNRIYPLTK